MRTAATKTDNHNHDFEQWRFQQYLYGPLRVYAIQVAKCRTCGFQIWDKQAVT